MSNGVIIPTDYSDNDYYGNEVIIGRYNGHNISRLTVDTGAISASTYKFLPQPQLANKTILNISGAFLQTDGSAVPACSKTTISFVSSSTGAIGLWAESAVTSGVVMVDYVQ